MPSISALEQNTYPPRVLVSVTGLTIGDRVEVYRVRSNVRTLLRAGESDSVSDTSFLVVDAELPFEAPISYLAVVEGTNEYATSLATYHLDSPEFDVLTDAVTGEAAQAIRVAQPEWEYQNQASVFVVNGRNIVVSNGTGQYSSEIEFYTEAESSGNNFRNVLTDATSGIIQLRDSLGGSDYVTVMSFREVRYSNDRTDDRRFFVLNVVQTDSWAATLEARGFTLQDVADYYGMSGTLDDLENDYPTLLAMAQGDFTV